MKTAHAPGPWFVKKMRTHYGYFMVDSKNGYHIAVSIGGLSINTEEANTRLIAAAPEMLDALYIAEEALIAAFQCFQSEHGPVMHPKTFAYLDTLDDVIKHAPFYVSELIIVRAAIAKATGN